MVGLQKLALAALAGLGAHAAVGGWAVVTVENLPDYLESGASYRIEYSVRQHGLTLLTGLAGTVLVQAGPADALTARAQPGSSTGRYVATFRVPDTERVTLSIRSGFSGGGWGDLTLMPIPVIRAGQRPAALTLADRGHRLFVAKGCGSCHVNGDVPEFAAMNRVAERGVGPELTGRRLEAAYVRQRLTNPSSLPKLGDTPVRMPNLGLAPNEVDALVALVSGQGQRAGM